ncbi:MAG: hypothetical protein ACK4YP_14025, partial [Myxococcota bacterium]
MWLLLACAGPGLDLAVALPVAENATALPADRFVGPLDVAGVPTEVLCGAPDRAALLAEGHYGWRVVVLDGAGVHPPGSTEGWEVTARRWRDADAAVQARCGERAATPVLLAAHRGAAFDAMALWRVHSWVDLTGAELFLLVDDATPTERAPPRPEAASGFVLVGTRRGWSVLTPHGGMEFRSARE